MKKSKFKKQVELLLETLPYVAKESCFALKGGTAINLFVRDFPRLSIDIDLAYLGSESRNQALVITEQALYRIKADLESHLSPVKVFSSSRDLLPNDVKLFITKNDVQIKIEANPVIRGTLLPVEVRTLSPKAVEEFEVEVDIQVSSVPDLYGGKIAAALDQQHPRDLFDIKLLFENEGLTRSITEGFYAYLLFHKRPHNEILRPTKKSMKSLFKSEFEGMSKINFTYTEFEETRDKLVNEINNKITSQSLAISNKHFRNLLFGRPQSYNLL
jgi:predicted nucleotidyltransferase component of viral defense system